ncbi:MAG: cytochrome P450 [Acidimicrobiales bacterium]|nr:cytochrome P450 [Acidimicrobiales bacterium]HJM27639.1 cytochrome P450 [Acidimicrobiales bacterium]
MTVTDLEYNPYAFALHDDPYETYQRLRDEAPAYWNNELSFWVLSRFEDVQNAFRDHEIFSSTGGVALESRRRRDADRPDFQQMIEMDPPDHTSFRKLVNRIFTGRRVAQMEEEIRSIFIRYLDQIIENGEADLVDDLTSPFPMDVISAFLDIPEQDREELRSHSDKILIREDGKMEIPQEAAEGMFAMLQYFIDDLPKRRQNPRKGIIDDLLVLEVDGRSLTEEELLGFCILFVIAGHETTTKMVANAIELLSRHPEQKNEIVHNLELAPLAVEEVLRYHNSTQYMHRTMSSDMNLHGNALKKGDSVLLLIGAANHDEREFGPTAGQFNIHRNPDRHLSFGYGAHFCLGAALARMEGKIALEEIHRRIPDYEVNHDAKIRFHSGNVTGWTKLPITFTPGTKST